MAEASFFVDTRDLRRLAQKWGTQADRLLMNELTTAAVKGGGYAKHDANVLIKGGENSRLAKAAKQTTRVDGATVSTVIDWNSARSATGFPYAAAVNTGRKAFGPVVAKVLVFQVNGQTVFARRVSAFIGIHFTTRGLASAKPKIDAEFHAAIQRWAARMGAV